jgi:hypothetical protein
VILASIPFVIAVPELIAEVLLWRLPLPTPGIAVLFFSIVGAILIFDLATCGFALVQWLWTGEPPELSFSPLAPTRQGSLLSMIVAGPIPGLPRAQSIGDKVTSSTA